MSPSTSSSLPRALVSLPAVRSGIRAALRQGGSVVDLRADAWGHGAAEIARIAMDEGASGVLVDAEDVTPLRALGIPAAVTGTADVDPRIVFGMPGTGVVPAMTLIGAVMSTKPLLPGDGVSYGYLFRAPSATRVALVTGGYAQGVVRALGNRAHVEIAGALHPIVGRVAMDVCVVEIGDAEVDEGATVTFFGGSGPAAGQLGQWARCTGLTPAEIVTAVGMHARREYAR